MTAPGAPPAYPGADPHVIAVSALDAQSRLYDRANRGAYVALAAPGVDVLVAAPGGAYDLTSGTSVACAEVSGVAALLLEKNPDLDGPALRRILRETGPCAQGCARGRRRASPTPRRPSTRAVSYDRNFTGR